MNTLTYFLLLLLFLALAGNAILIAMLRKAKMEGILHVKEMERSLAYSKYAAIMLQQTLARIGENVKNNIGQILSVVKLKIGMLSKTHTGEATANELNDMLAFAIGDLRGISEVSDHMLACNDSFIHCLQYEVHYWEKNGLSITLVYDVDDDLLAHETKMILLGILQQCFMAIIKCGDKSSAEISVKSLNKMLTIVASLHGQQIGTCITSNFIHDCSIGMTAARGTLDITNPGSQEINIRMCVPLIN